MRLIAHRGGRGFGTDNTVAAMEAAVRAGVRRIETDIRSTGDGRLLVCHDSMIWGHIVSRTTYEELRHHTPERPLLYELLEALAGWVNFNLEIKEAPPAQVAETLELYGVLEDCVVTSFDIDKIAEFKRLSPRTRTGLLYRMPYGRDRKFERALESGADIIAPYFNSIDAELVRDAHAAGLEVCAWTVNEDDDLRKLRDWRVDTVITDKYIWMEELLRSLDGSQE